MSEESAEFEAHELLRTIGKVQVPEPGVLEAAREALWSAVAAEMLGTGPAGDQASTTVGSARRGRQAGRSDGERRMSMGGGGDPQQ